MAANRNDILKLSAELMKCVRKDDIIGARSIISNISKKKDRKLIVAKRENRNHDGDEDCSTPLFEAVVGGNVEMVRFLVKECYADLEERVSLFMDHLVTPLWCAAVMNKLEVVKCLIDLGADINAASSSGSTPVSSACAQSSPAVAECLIRYGANVEKKNKFGETCLMKAVMFKELCKCLIDSGVKVMDQDEFGCLALHYAIKRNQSDTVQLLLNQGSDPYVENQAGDDAFRTASLKGKELILNELLFKLKPPVQRWIESYQLLGGYYIDFGDDTDKALKFWKEAVDIQQKNSFVEIIPSKPNPAYLLVQEVNTVEELEALARNHELVQMYALMIRERILGPNHDNTISVLFNRGRSYQRTGETQRCIDIWKHGFLLQSSPVGQLTYRYSHNFYSLCSVMHIRYEEVRQPDRSDDQLVLINDSHDVLEMVTIKFEQTLGNKPVEKNIEEVLLADFMKSILIFIIVLTDLDSNAYQVCSFRNIVHCLVRCQLRNKHGRTLLHLSISPILFLRDNRGFISLLPSIAVVELLLECGANVNAVDDKHNTALHLCSELIHDPEMTQSHDLIKRKAELLLKKGAHADMVNFSGDSAAEILTSSLIGWNVLNYVSLKCLAARAVLKYKISYVGHIPVSLESFVQMHGTPTADSDHSDA